ncbi:hypothetical protein LECLMA074M_12635 [Leclercia sp. M-A074-M]
MHGLDCVFNHVRFSEWSSAGQYTIFFQFYCIVKCYIYNINVFVRFNISAN